MAHTMWFNEYTGQRLSATELVLLEQRAARLYEVNTHIFEDQHEALESLGVVSLAKHLDAVASASRGDRSLVA